MTVRDRIKELAVKECISLPNLESLLGFGNGTILKWDKNTPNTDKLAKVADHFGVSVDYLLGRETNASIDSDLRKIERARNKMSQKEKEKMMKMLELSFEEYFSDDFEDDDIDE